MANSKPTALITGASTGMGKEFALLLAKKNYHLVLVALEEDLLAALAAQIRTQSGVNVIYFATDLSQTNAVNSIIHSLDKQNIEIDLLINNAGLGIKGPFHTMDQEIIRKMILVNMLALTDFSRQLAPKMVQNGGGKILNIASTAAFQPGPGMAVYFATKAYILSLSQALTEEFRELGVTVTVICPGPTATEFVNHANLKNNPIHSSSAIPMLDPRDVAEYGYKVLLKKKRMATVGMVNKIYGFLARISPKGVVMRILKHLHEQ